LVIEKMMGTSKHPFKAFKDYISYYNKSLRFVKINMMLDTPCAGNMEENLLNLYSYRGNPSFILVDPEMKTTTDQETNFLTKMSMGEDTKDPIYENKLLEITLLDTKMTMAMKLSKFGMDRWNYFDMIHSEKVLYNYSKKMGIRFWCDFSLMIIAIESTKEVTFCIYSNYKEIDEVVCFPILSMIKREMVDYEARGYEVFMQDAPYRMNKSGYMYIYSKLSFLSKVVHKDLNWYMNLHFRVGHVEDTDTTKIYTFKFFNDKYTMNKKDLNSVEMDDDLTLGEMLEDPPRISEIDHILLSKGWISKSILKNKEVSDSETSMDELRNYNESFGNLGLENTIGKMVSGYKFEEEFEDIKTEIDLNDEKEDSMSAMRQAAIEVHKALKGFMSTNDDFEESVNLKERLSIIKVMDKMVTNAFEQSVTVDRDLIKKMYQVFSRNQNTMGFHNFLLSQIRWYYYKEESTDLSDGTLLMIYNILIKKYCNTLSLFPSNSLEKTPLREFKENTMILKNIKERRDLEDIAEEFM